jgi:hypothetical protein
MADIRKPGPKETQMRELRERKATENALRQQAVLQAKGKRIGKVQITGRLAQRPR